MEKEIRGLRGIRVRSCEFVVKIELGLGLSASLGMSLTVLFANSEHDLAAKMFVLQELVRVGRIR